MNGEVYAAELVRVHMLAQLLMTLPLAEMRRAQDRADTLGPMLDPTLWMKNGRKLEQDAQVTGILRRAQSELAKIMPPSAALTSEPSHEQ